MREFWDKVKDFNWGCLIMATIAVLFISLSVHQCIEDRKNKKHLTPEQEDSIAKAREKYFDSLHEADKREEIDGEIWDLQEEGYHVYSDWNEEFVLMWESHGDEIEEFVIESLRENNTDKELIDIFEIGQKREKDDMPPRASLGE